MTNQYYYRYEGLGRLLDGEELENLVVVGHRQLLVPPPPLCTVYVWPLCMYVFMYVCMYVCVCMCIYIYRERER